MIQLPIASLAAAPPSKDSPKIERGGRTINPLALLNEAQAKVRPPMPAGATGLQATALPHVFIRSAPLAAANAPLAGGPAVVSEGGHVYLRLGAPAAAATQPQGGQFVAGTGSINYGGSTVTISQSSARGIVDWNSFSLGSGQSAVFNNGNGATLNRVTGPSMSTIAGRITATGSLYLVNPQGIVFGADAKIVAGGAFVAATGGPLDAAFMAGDQGIWSAGPSAPITVAGSIGAAHIGILTGGVVTTEAGSSLTATAADGAGGSVRIAAGGGTARIGGTINVDAAAASAAGGAITISGDQVALQDGAGLSAQGHGAGSGGTVMIGGDPPKGRGAAGFGSVGATSSTVTMAPTAKIAANGGVNGDGGKIRLWADRLTQFEGSLAARGGALSGNGGQIETSAGATLLARGQVDSGAAHGAAGTWLLDPYDVIIQAAGANLIPGAGGTFTPSGTSSTVDAASIVTALSNGNNVTITTVGTPGAENGDITVAAALATNVSAGAPTLTLSAAGSVLINQPITGSGRPFNVNFSAGTGSVAFAANVQTGTSVGELSAGSITATGPTISVASGVTVAANASGNCAAAAKCSGGAISLTATASLTNNGTISSTTAGTCSFAAGTGCNGGAITLSAPSLTNAAGATISAQALGSASCTVATASGCDGGTIGLTVTSGGTASLAGNINVNSLPAAAACTGTGAYCAGGTITLTANAAPGAATVSNSFAARVGGAKANGSMTETANGSSVTFLAGGTSITGGSLTVNATSGSITDNGAIAVPSGSTLTETVTAGSIGITADPATGGGNLTLNATGAAGSVAISSNVTTGNGALTLAGAGSLSVGGAAPVTVNSGTGTQAWGLASESFGGTGLVSLAASNADIGLWGTAMTVTGSLSIHPTGSGNISDLNPIAYNGAAGSALTWNAGGSIYIVKPITVTAGSYSLALTSGANGSIIDLASIATNGGDLTYNSQAWIGGSYGSTAATAVTLSTKGGAATFNGAVVLGNGTMGVTVDTTSSAGAGGAVTFASTVDSGFDFTLSAASTSWVTSQLNASSTTTNYATVGDTWLATPLTLLEANRIDATASLANSGLGGQHPGLVTAWVGGSDFNSRSASCVPCTWYWVSGPLAIAGGGALPVSGTPNYVGTQFFTKTANTVAGYTNSTNALTGLPFYTDWNAPYQGGSGQEPNNSAGTEAGNVVNYIANRWNDYGVTGTNNNYVTEKNIVGTNLTLNAGSSATTGGAISFAGALGNSPSGLYSNKTLALGNLTISSARGVSFGAGVGKVVADGTVTIASGVPATFAGGLSIIATTNNGAASTIAINGSLTSAGANALTLQANSMSLTGGTLSSAGIVTLDNETALRPITLGGSAGGTLSLSATDLQAVTGASVLRIGANSGTTSGAITIAGAVTFGSGVGAVDLATPSTVTEAAGATIGANGLGVQAAGAVGLAGGNNAISALAVSDAAGTVTYTGSGNASIGSIDGISGITAGGLTSITTTGALAVTKPVTTSSTANGGLTLVSGSATAAGTASGGDITVSGTGSVSVGAGGTILLYTGSVAGSTGLAAAAGGSGSGNFRYDSSPSSAGYSRALAGTVSVLYREQPSLTGGISLPGGASRVYDSSISTPTATASGAVNGDVPTLAGASFSVTGSLQNANSATVSLTALSNDLGYGIALPAPLTYTITPAPLTVTVTASATKSYDGTTAVIGSTPSVAKTGGTLYGGDTLNLTGATFAYTSAAAGTNKSVTASLPSTGLVTQGATDDSSNYAVSVVASAGNAITPAPLTLTVSATSKSYDATTAAPGAGLSVSSGTLFGADTLIPSAASYAYASPAAGTGKSVAATLPGSGLITAGAADQTGNYAITLIGNTTSAITQAPLTLTVASATKTYDATISVPGGTASITAGSLFGSDTLNGGTLGFAYNSAAAGTGKSVTATLPGSGLITAGAADQTGNYAITLVGNNTSVINPAPITLTVTAAATKTYDGTTAVVGSTPSIAKTAGVLFGGDMLTTSGAVYSYGTSAAGANKSITATLPASNVITNGATDETGNYAVTVVASTGNAITPAPLTLTVGSASKTYDATTSVPGGTASVTAGSLFGADTLNLGTVGFAYNSPAVGTGKSVTATLPGSGLITAGASDQTGNYTITLVNNNASTILKEPVTVSVASVSKTYDGTTAVTGGAESVTSGTLFGGDAINVTGVTYSYNSASAGTGKTVTATLPTGGLITHGAIDDSANYAVTLVNSTNSTILQAPLTLSVTAAATKTYDGTTNASASGSLAVTSGALIGGDGLNAGTASYAFTTAAAGTHKSITATLPASGLITHGAADDTADYAITLVPSTNGTITPAPLTLTVTPTSKTYDATANAPGAGLTVSSGTLFGADTLIPSTASYAFSSAAVGSNKTVTATLPGAGLIANGGADSTGNYTVTLVGNNTSAITQAPLTLAVGSVTKTYDGTTSVPGGTVSLARGTLFGGDTLNLAGIGYAYDSASAGSGKTVSASLPGAGLILQGGTDDTANYAISLINNNASSIQRAALTLTVGATASKVYDGTTAFPNGGTLTLTGGALIGGDVLNVGTARYEFATPSAGANKAITAILPATGLVTHNSVDDTGNYALTLIPSNSGTITPAPLTLTVNPITKTYDATTTAPGAGLSVTSGKLFGSDTLNPSSAGYAFASPAAGVNKSVTATLPASGLIASNGADETANYAITLINNASSAITQAPLTLTVAGASKTYDATTAVPGGSLLVTSGTLFGADRLAPSGVTFAYDNAGAGSGKTINATLPANGLITQGGADETGNYAINLVANHTGLIAPAPLTLTVTAAASKTYDGTTNLTGGGSLAVTGGRLFGGDALDPSLAIYQFATPSAGTDKAITAAFKGAGPISRGGIDESGNYAISLVPSDHGTITQAPLAVTAVSASHVTGTPNPPFQLADYASQLAPGDTTATVAVGGITFTTNATAASPPGSYDILLSGGALSGAQAGNYRLVLVDDKGGLTVEPMVLTIAPITPSTLPLSAPSWSFNRTTLDGAAEDFAATGRAVQAPGTTANVTNLARTPVSFRIPDASARTLNRTLQLLRVINLLSSFDVPKSIIFEAHTPRQGEIASLFP